MRAEFSCELLLHTVAIGKGAVTPAQSKGAASAEFSSPRIAASARASAMTISA
jgi:hypothetical protein